MSKSKAQTVAYDLADQLRTPTEMAAYLDAWLNEAPDDIAGIARALGDIARAKGMFDVARALGEDGNPSFSIVLQVTRALGLRLHAEVA